MALPFVELQTAVYQRLSTDASLLNLVTGVYDHVTEETPFPYVYLGEPMLNIDQEVKIEEIVEETIAIHVYHNQATNGEYGNVKVYEIIASIHEALKYKIELTSYEIMQVTPHEPRVFDDIDNVHKHGVITYKYKLLKTK
ncbi:DUF3168 domain-containing protein [Lysinibacillus piscis]|uniref:DUF3168 domain-containing protein n=1 Tax=Lysinibacillus piscis TaxID=2518931 RepID=A0ABQ5NLZ8_9BACI|nr:DUF3168 domain-containing protein [Lysinibacillus sp. KH24]GLC89333.1 hypothetical protein LYSBPC_24600 [Lysinibacillus sp. KH24]